MELGRHRGSSILQTPLQWYLWLNLFIHYWLENIIPVFNFLWDSSKVVGERSGNIQDYLHIVIITHWYTSYFTSVYHNIISNICNETDPTEEKYLDDQWAGHMIPGRWSLVRPVNAAICETSHKFTKWKKCLMYIYRLELAYSYSSHFHLQLNLNH